MRLNKFRQAPGDRKRYVVNYADWLNAGELINAVLMNGSVVDDGFIINGYIIDTGNQQIIFYATGGISGKSYDVSVVITTTLAQTKTDWITIVVT